MLGVVAASLTVQRIKKTTLSNKIWPKQIHGAVFRFD